MGEGEGNRKKLREKRFVEKELRKMKREREREGEE